MTKGNAERATAGAAGGRDIFVAREADIAEGGRKVIVAGDFEVGVFRVGGKLYAWRNECPHAGGPVCQGRLMKRVEERLDENRRSLGIENVDGTLDIICPWHGFEFDVCTGRHVGLSRIRLQGYPVKVRKGEIYVTIGS